MIDKDKALRRLGLMFFSAILTIFLVVLSTGFVLAETWVSEGPSDDSWIQSNDPEDNHGNSVFLGVRFDIDPDGNESNVDVRKSFIRFDLDPVLNNVLISSASLRLFMHEAPNIERSHTVRRVIEDWEEGNITWNNSPNVSSFITDSQTIGTEDDIFVEFDVTVDVAIMAAGVYDNFGWRIDDNSEISEVITKYRSKEFGNESLSPVLIVEYSNETNFTDFNSPDLNGDGVVGVVDLLILLGNWGDCPENRGDEDCIADIYPDGVVGPIDLHILLALWGPFTDGDLFEVSLIEPSGTYEFLGGIPINFTIEGEGNFTCFYNVTLASGGIEINNTEIIDCINGTNTDSFNVLAEESYIFYLTVNDGNDNFVFVNSSFSVDVPDDGDGNGGNGGNGNGDTDSDGGRGCRTDWVCTEWIECDPETATQNRTCTKERSYCYANPNDKPEETQECIVGEQISIQPEETTTPFQNFISRLTGAVIGPGGNVRPVGVIMFIAFLVAAYSFMAAWRVGKKKGSGVKKKETSAANNNRKNK